ncbi:hypothetical protein HK097_008220 [Rhizophlyctis rosea]|uniref:Uncharacterized protein n=1 Tax=Rhizophlyctis rosea TaxID=64517 RepID=A0AAD5X1U3_9FUNG|nr:hypothetical protein HK097_008220 [Rhizophlyctis rosea]
MNERKAFDKKPFPDDRKMPYVPLDPEFQPPGTPPFESPPIVGFPIPELSSAIPDVADNNSSSPVAATDDQPGGPSPEELERQKEKEQQREVEWKNAQELLLERHCNAEKWSVHMDVENVVMALED